MAAPAGAAHVRAVLPPTPPRPAGSVGAMSSSARMASSAIIGRCAACWRTQVSLPAAGRPAHHNHLETRIVVGIIVQRGIGVAKIHEPAVVGGKRARLRQAAQLGCNTAETDRFDPAVRVDRHRFARAHPPRPAARRGRAARPGWRLPPPAPDRPCRAATAAARGGEQAWPPAHGMGMEYRRTAGIAPQQRARQLLTLDGRGAAS